MSVAPAFPSYLVTPEMLHDALNNRQRRSGEHRIIPLSAAWFLSSDGRRGIDCFRRKRIPNSIFCDLDSLADKTSAFPQMLPSADQFASVLGSLGITPGDAVVIYDTEELGIFSAPRVAWLFKTFGHERVYILNNFRLWVKLGLPVETGEMTVPESIIYPTPSRDDSRVILFEELRDLVLNGHVPHSVQILDSRSAKFWTRGPPAESTPVTGHIPHSIHLPLPDILDPNNKTILPSPQLRKIFQAKGIKHERTLVTTCGAGITAAVVEVALEEAGYGTKMSRRLFDGSWR
ncbi:unnamed protein product [Clonostachys solani]|uniref:Rhodanese domain-containing protein n=1 Tax=Clonostachys solani TaxID=160281 RepID=A0A9P0EL78_9HYPO|nr:unnamed protein product [Clonostachys solani]